MAKINFSVILTRIGGKPLKDDEDKDLSLAGAAKQALLVLDDKQTGSEKYNNYCLATKVVNGGIVELKSEDISKIKELIGKYMYPVVVGQAWDLLEGQDPKK